MKFTRLSLIILTLLGIVQAPVSRAECRLMFQTDKPEFITDELLETLSADSALVRIEPMAGTGGHEGDADTVPGPGRRGFFRKVGDYFKNSNEDRTQSRKFDFSILGGPHYSADVKLGLGIVAAGLYRIDREDMSIPPSNISLYGDITTSGFYLLGIRGNTFFNGGKYRLDFKTYFYSMPSKFWGIGYNDGRHNKNITFDRDQMQVRVDFMYRVYTNWYVGADVFFNYTRGRNIDDITYFAGQKTKYSNTGAGLFILHDSRDAITAPQRGWFFRLENTGFPEFMGNKPRFNFMEGILDFYHPVWKGGTLAYDLHGVWNKGNVPWSMMSLLGGSFRMRGYYEGRYRDKNIIEVQAELRQKIWRRIGATAWVGAGNVFPSAKNFEWKQTLPSYGVGFRWEFKNRVNVRLDYGMGKNSSAFMFNINEAF